MNVYRSPIFFLLLSNFCFAQSSDTADYYSSGRMRYENFTYLKNIKTVQLRREGNELSSPTLDLNGTDKLELSFDDLEGDEKDYSYTFIHCTANWEPSDLLESDFMIGYMEDRIRLFRYSFNTIQRYTHYSLVFPNEDIQLSKSGNYVIKVFAGYDKKQLVLTRRFMLFENKITLETDVHPASGADTRRSHQEVDFTIYHNGYDINNPFSDLKILLVQNDRWDNSIKDLKPIFIKDKELVYDYERENLFKGGNEFRPFDFRSLHFNSARLDHIRFEPLEAPADTTDSTIVKYFNVYLLPDQKKSYMRYYSTERDINGKYLITNQDVKNSNADTEADYAFVHFSLPYPSPIADGNLYVGGELTDWAFTNENKMNYNYSEKSYECTLYLKQGYYNYEYFFLGDGISKADETYIEGNHSETENAYAIYVYHREIGSRYDRLIGIKFVNSAFGH